MTKNFDNDVAKAEIISEYITDCGLNNYDSFTISNVEERGFALIFTENCSESSESTLSVVDLFTLFSWMYLKTKETTND